MTHYVIDKPPRITAPIKNTDALFPVRRIYCIGRNYADHAIEMGHDPDREPPFFFQKNPDNLDFSGTFTYPAKSQDVHYEIELVIAIGKGGKDISLDSAVTHVYGYALGLDMTRRDLQGEMKKMGRPWEIGKAFEKSAPMGPIIPASDLGHPVQGLIDLKVNGVLKQKGDLNQMIWKTADIISYLSTYYELAAGDLIMSGTPAGVGPIVKGDIMTGSISGMGELIVKVV
ncbi:MAG: fumarylacetoacetate hydrolase family protein [Planktomarina sp.]|nr:fumarylacetoacetate hydrolase family protein [Planktomarina sp.]|tara:strand:+ start:1138 stop:1824 length:687 start_codon:yes stop_codon:yes gene_type:complete